MQSSRNGEKSVLERAIGVVSRLKAGNWESVETMAVLAIASQDRPEAAALVDEAIRTASKLKDGSWESARALAWLARAQQETG